MELTTENPWTTDVFVKLWAAEGEKNKGKKQTNARLYYGTYCENHKEKARLYYQNNKEKAKLYYERNKEKKKQYKKLYYDKNKEKRNEYRMLHSANKNGENIKQV